MSDVKQFEYEYNPIKESKNGVEAEKVIWTTKALNIAVDAIKKGLPLKANPFCGKNVQLLKPDLVYKRTAEEIADYLKCREDPVYFASKCFLMTPEGLKACKLRDYQIEYLEALKEHNFTILLSCRQAGKCFSPLEKIKIKIKNISYNDDILKKLNYYYVNDDIYSLPIFELYNLFCKQTMVWKVKYHLYKIIYVLENGRKKRNDTNYKQGKFKKIS